MFYMYILLCSDGSYYTGHTDQLEKRIEEHQAGVYEGYTKSRRPVKIVFQQSFSTREEAFSAERKVKKWSKRKKEAMIQANWAEVSRLAKTKGHSLNLIKSNPPSTYAE